MEEPLSIFPGRRQISPATEFPVTSRDPPLLASSQSSIKPASMASGDMISSTSSSRCLIDYSLNRDSSPGKPSIKRRKSQAKKVVCVPAPAPANSRSTGEAVPSDLWAWRKYGEKPIKGSPFPSDCGASLKPSNGRQGQKRTSQEEEEGEEGKNLCVKEETEEIDQIKGLEMADEDQFDEAFAGCTSGDFFFRLDEIPTDDDLLSI